MSIYSWNVNGLRAIYKKNFLSWFNDTDPDILCLQETRLVKQQIPDELKTIDGYYTELYPAKNKKGYSGTMTLSKHKPMKVLKGMGIKEYDQEGRVLTFEYEKFYIVNIYTPNSQRGLTRLDYRQKWDDKFLDFIKRLDKKKPVIFCGDLNVAHKEIDLANPKQNEGNHGFTQEEKQGFSNILNSGFIDTFRIFNQEGGNYTWWSYYTNARERNVGWRIDYICASKRLKNKIKEAFILDEVPGSDHCPIGITFEEKLNK
ncbi:exodeoxyribonuclease III [Candidatus Dojkabacteria bacterium]|nr:exodeoxyribonuclease III [Candidatus Dojkabacteria bacterium]